MLRSEQLEQSAHAFLEDGAVSSGQRVNEAPKVGAQPMIQKVLEQMPTDYPGWGRREDLRVARQGLPEGHE